MLMGEVMGDAIVWMGKRDSRTLKGKVRTCIELLYRTTDLNSSYIPSLSVVTGSIFQITNPTFFCCRYLKARLDCVDRRSGQ